MLRRSLLALTLGLWPALASAQELLAVSWSGNAYRIDLPTATITSSSSTGLGLGCNALAIDPSGTIWSTRRTGPTGSWVYDLIRIDPVTLAGTIHHAAWGLDVRGMAADPVSGMLWCIVDGSPDTLQLYDPVTQTATLIGPTGRSSIQGLALLGGTFYAWDISVGLMTVDPTTGLATDVDPNLGTQSAGIQFLGASPTGGLIGGQNQLYDVDPLTGIATQRVPAGAFSDLRGGEIVSGSCSVSYGSGCPGDGGFVPTLATLGCFQAGASGTLNIGSGPGNTVAMLLFGGITAQIPIAAGCDLLLGQLFPAQVILNLAGSGPGTGTATLVAPIPAGSAGRSFTMQAFVADLSTPQLFTVTPGLFVTVQ